MNRRGRNLNSGLGGRRRHPGPGVRTALCALITAGVVLLAGAGCRPGSIGKAGKGMTLQEVQAIQERHQASLLALPGVVGVYIGAREDSSLCLRVLVRRKTPEVEAGIPARLEGCPVEVEETDEIKPMPGGGR